MFHHRFRILTPLLILWQLLILSSAQWLHTCQLDCCAVDSGEQWAIREQVDSCNSTALGSACCRCNAHRTALGSSEDDEEQTPEQKKHDCSNCSICQAISAPRILVSVVKLATSEQFISSIEDADCADPMLGFGLPPQCRAPPRS
jgi:hypothetical protein